MADLTRIPQAQRQILANAIHLLSNPTLAACTNAPIALASDANLEVALKRFGVRADIIDISAALSQANPEAAGMLLAGALAQTEAGRARGLVCDRTGATVGRTAAGHTAPVLGAGARDSFSLSGYLGEFAAATAATDAGRQAYVPIIKDFQAKATALGFKVGGNDGLINVNGNEPRNGGTTGQVLTCIQQAIQTAAPTSALGQLRDQTPALATFAQTGVYNADVSKGFDAIKANAQALGQLQQHCAQHHRGLLTPAAATSADRARIDADRAAGRHITRTDKIAPGSPADVTLTAVEADLKATFGRDTGAHGFGAGVQTGVRHSAHCIAHLAGKHKTLSDALTAAHVDVQALKRNPGVIDDNYLRAVEATKAAIATTPAIATELPACMKQEQAREAEAARRAEREAAARRAAAERSSADGSPEVTTGRRRGTPAAGSGSCSVRAFDSEFVRSARISGLDNCDIARIGQEARRHGFTPAMLEGGAASGWRPWGTIDNPSTPVFQSVTRSHGHAVPWDDAIGVEHHRRRRPDGGFGIGSPGRPTRYRPERSGGGDGGGSGGDCFLAGTPILMADGSYKSVEELAVGDAVQGVDGVVNTVIATPQLPLAGRTLYGFNGQEAFVTAGHPFLTTDGWSAIDPSQTPAEKHGVITRKLEIGDTLITSSGEVVVESIEVMTAEMYSAGSVAVGGSAAVAMGYQFVYNPMLDGNHTYYAADYAVHNKGGSGCFVPGTPIEMADGSFKPVEALQVGDVVKGHTRDNTVIGTPTIPLSGRSIYSFNGGEGFVTAGHPFLTTQGWSAIDPSQTVMEKHGVIVRKLEIGDMLLTDAGEVVLRSIEEITAEMYGEGAAVVGGSGYTSTGGYQFVHNPMLDGDHTYYAAGYVVHNKGAGGCFVKDTLITMADGSRKLVQDLKEGDVVKGQTQNNTIKSLPTNTLGTRTLHAINGSNAFVTAGHPLMTKAGWKAVDPSLTSKEDHDVVTTKLEVGDVLITFYGEVEVKSIETHVGDANIQIFNPKMDGDHTYYANGFLAHNAGT